MNFNGMLINAMAHLKLANAMELCLLVQFIRFEKNATTGSSNIYKSIGEDDIVRCIQYIPCVRARLASVQVVNWNDLEQSQ